MKAPKWTPHGYQKKAVKFLLEHGAGIALLDPGLGKTSITLAAFDMLRQEGTARLLVVIAPLRVAHLVWPAEAAEWKDFQHLRVGVLHGKQKDDILADHANYDVLVINPEGLDWLVGKHTPGQLRKVLDGAVLAIDELTRFKNSTGKRFKMLKKILNLFSRRWGLTGTPAPNGLLDLFGQCYVIDEGAALGRYVTHYKRDFFRPLDPNGWKWALQPGAEQRIYERLEPLAIRMSAEEYLQLPERIDLRHEIDLPPKVRKLYDQLEEDLIAKFEAGEIVAGNAAAASTKCRQICNGALYVDDDVASYVAGKRRSVLTLHELKLDAVEELLENLQGNQLLLGYEFNHDLDAIFRRFGKNGKMPYIGSGVTAKQAQDYEREWNRGNIQLLPCHPASAGHGLNMQKSNAANVGWYGVPWNYEYYDQFIRRILRQGNTAKRIMNHHFIARNTVDVIALYDKQRKARGQSALFDALKALRDMRK